MYDIAELFLCVLRLPFTDFEMHLTDRPNVLRLRLFDRTCCVWYPLEQTSFCVAINYATETTWILSETGQIGGLLETTMLHPAHNQYSPFNLLFLVRYFDRSANSRNCRST